MKKWELQLLAGFLSVGLFFGCASMRPLTNQQAATANNAVTVAQGLLHSLDGFYNDLLALRLVPNHTTEATRSLAIADQAAATLRQVIAGATVTDEQMNIAAGQVSGARAILAGVKYAAVN